MLCRLVLMYQLAACKSSYAPQAGCAKIGGRPKWLWVKLNSRGTQVAHDSTYQGPILEFRFFEPQPNIFGPWVLGFRARPSRPGGFASVLPFRQLKASSASKLRSGSRPFASLTLGCTNRSREPGAQGFLKRYILQSVETCGFSTPT